MADHPGLRIGTTEREQAVELLTRHLGEGRLTVAEFDDRCTRVASACTGSELATLFADLPEVQGQRRRGRTAWVLVPLSVLVVGLYFVFADAGLALWYVPIVAVLAVTAGLAFAAIRSRARTATPAFLRADVASTSTGPRPRGSLVPYALVLMLPALVTRQPILLLVAAGFLVYAVVSSLGDGRSS